MKAEFYNQLSKDVDVFNGSIILELLPIIEDTSSLVLDLKFGYIYFQVEERNLGKYKLTYHKFNSKLIKCSETTITLDNYKELVNKIHNVVVYNLKVDKRKK